MNAKAALALALALSSPAAEPESASPHCVDAGKSVQVNPAPQLEKTCPCSSLCTCGCNAGEVCECHTLSVREVGRVPGPAFRVVLPASQGGTLPTLRTRSACPT